MNSMVDVEDPAYVQTTEGNKMSAEVQPNQMTFSRHNKIVTAVVLSYPCARSCL